MEDVITLTPEEEELILQRRAQGYDPNAKREFGQPPAPNPLSITVTRVPSAQDMAKKRQDTISAVGREHYLHGVQNPKTSPMGAAASDQAQKRYENQMKDPNVLARRQSKLKGVTDTIWLAMVEAVGADNFVKSVAAKGYKYEQFALRYKAELSRICAAVDAMPNSTLDERIARSAFVQRELAKLKGKV